MGHEGSRITSSFPGISEAAQNVAAKLTSLPWRGCNNRTTFCGEAASLEEILIPGAHLGPGQYLGHSAVLLATILLTILKAPGVAGGRLFLGLYTRVLARWDPATLTTKRSMENQSGLKKTKLLGKERGSGGSRDCPTVQCASEL